MKTGTINLETQSQVPVAATTTEVLAENADRHYASFKNVSTAQISLKFGAAAVVEDGTVLEPGESYEMSEQLGNLELDVVNAIHDGGAQDEHVLAFTEGISP